MVARVKHSHGLASVALTVLPGLALGESEEDFGAAEGVFEEHGDGHGADAAGDRGDEAGFLLHRVEVDVAYGLLGAVGGSDAVDANVDHDRVLPYVIRRDKPRFARGDN